MILQQIYSGNHVPHFTRIAPSFVEDINKKYLVSFLRDTVYLVLSCCDLTLH